MSRFETSSGSDEAVDEEIGDENQYCNTGSAIIETQLSILASLDARIGLIDAVLW